MRKPSGSTNAWIAVACHCEALACGGKVAPDGFDDGSDSGADPAPQEGTGGDSPGVSTGGAPATFGGAGGGRAPPPASGGFGGTLGTGGAPFSNGGARGEVPLAELLRSACVGACSCSGSQGFPSCESECFRSLDPISECPVAREMIECVAGVIADVGACTQAFSRALDAQCGPYLTRYAECLQQPPPQSCSFGVTIAPDFCTVEAELCDDGNGYRVDCKFSSETDLACYCWDALRGDMGSFMASSPSPVQEFCGPLAFEACGFPVSL
jgi:hypothetical protein